MKEAVTKNEESKISAVNLYNKNRKSPYRSYHYNQSIFIRFLFFNVDRVDVILKMLFSLVLSGRKVTTLHLKIELKFKTNLKVIFQFQSFDYLFGELPF